MSTAAQPVVVDPPVRRGTAAVVGLGVALLAAAAAVSAVYARQDDDLDWSVFGVGLGATGVLLLVTLAGSLGADLEVKRALTGFPGAVGAISAGVMLGIYFEDDDWLPWAIGGVILGVSVVAYVLGRAGAPTVSAIAGLAILYGKAVEELIDVDDDQTLIVGGAIVVVFVVAVTAIGWVLPHRALVGVVVGAGGTAALLGLVVTDSFLRSFAGPMADIATDSGTGPSAPTGANEIENDIYIVLAYSAALILMWTLAAWATGSSGFRVLAVVHAAAIVPLSMTILAVEHPTWWGGGIGAAGTVLALLALAGALRGRRTPPAASTTGERPPPFFGGSPPPPSSPASGTPASGTPARDKPEGSSTTPPPGRSDATVIAPASAPPPPDPNQRRPK